MSDTYAIGCNDCKKQITVGQSTNAPVPFCFYSGEPETMSALRDFLYAHFEHNLTFDFADLLWDKYDPITPE